MTAKKKSGRGPGRPSLYTSELVAKICAFIADGQSLRSICKAKGMPTRQTVMEWLGIYPAFADQYARARAASADVYAEDIIDIADDPKLDPQDKRVRVDARKWAASKLKPKKYGDRITAEHTGAVGTYDLTSLSDEDLDRLEGILGKVALAGSGPSGES